MTDRWAIHEKKIGTNLPILNNLIEPDPIDFTIDFQVRKTGKLVKYIHGGS